MDCGCFDRGGHDGSTVEEAQINMHRRGLPIDEREAVGCGLVWAIQVPTYIATLPLLQQKKRYSSAVTIMRRGDGHIHVAERKR
jgi:hypothetical protein